MTVKTILQVMMATEGDVIVTNYSYNVSVIYIENESCYWIQDKIDD